MEAHLLKEIKEIISQTKATHTVRDRYRARVKERNVTRIDDPVSHFCVYFFPFDWDAKKVFIVSHKKSGLWLSPGGHIEPGESLYDTVTREIREELGMDNPLPRDAKPKLLTVTDIQRDSRACRVHFDIWFFLPTDGTKFFIGTDEFHETRWVTIDEAEVLLEDANNLEALKLIGQEFKS